LHIADFSGSGSAFCLIIEASGPDNITESPALAGKQADCLLFVQTGTDFECFRARRT
jgi:hypothetical protein